MELIKIMLIFVTMKNLTEEWIPILGTGHNYEISSLGRVRRVTFTEREKLPLSILKPRADKDGYLRVNLYFNGKKVTSPIHKLVARHFIEGYRESLVVNHKDEDKQNNIYTNLEWVTVSYNNTHNNIHLKKP